jgi:hypothetical protein
MIQRAANIARPRLRWTRSSMLPMLKKGLLPLMGDGYPRGPVFTAAAMTISSNYAAFAIPRST